MKTSYLVRNFFQIYHLIELNVVNLLMTFLEEFSINRKSYVVCDVHYDIQCSQEVLHSHLVLAHQGPHYPTESQYHLNFSVWVIASLLRYQEPRNIALKGELWTKYLVVQQPRREILVNKQISTGLGMLNINFKDAHRLS